MNLNDNEFKNLLKEVETEDNEVFNKLASDMDSDSEKMKYSDKVNQPLLKKYLDLTGDTVEMFNRMAENYIAEKFNNAGTDTEHISYVENIINTELNAFGIR